MISETSFAKRFTSFWNELLPNAKNYVRLINSALRSVTHKPLEPSERRHNTAFVNTLAFGIYSELTLKGRDLGALLDPEFRTSFELSEIARVTAEGLERFRDYTPHELPLLDSEWEQTLSIVRLLHSRYYWKVGPILEPAFDGCGFLSAARGDIFVRGKLVEIKSGERSFSLADLRQLLIYCMLNHFSRTQLPIVEVELFNPRMGILFSETVDEFSRSLSSLEPVDLFAEIGSFVSETAFIEDKASDF